MTGMLVRKFQKNHSKFISVFLDYVSKNYVNGPPNGTGPRYPIDEWTVTARLGAARTNCSAEAFNSVFSVSDHKINRPVLDAINLAFRRKLALVVRNWEVV